MRHVLAGFAVAAALMSVPAAVSAASDPVELAPLSRWSVEFADDKCRLARTFGAEDNLHVLIFEQHYPNDEAGLTLAGPALSRFRSRAPTALTYYTGQEEIRGEPFAGELGDVGKAVIYSNVGLEPEDDDEDSDAETVGVPQLDLALGDKVEFVSVKQRGREVRFVTGPLGRAFEVLNTCTLDMIREWGLEVDQHVNATRTPKWTNEGAIARQIVRRYPRAALRDGDQAILRMRVIVDADGSVEQCTIDAATTNDLVSPACEEMDDAVFEPALDAEGEPFRSYFATTIVYQIGR
ncbi:MAG: energy transducer TonB [Erythrobacter sp.]